MTFDELIASIKNWGEAEADIKAIILVGSYARGTFKDSSDIDLVILTADKAKLISNSAIFHKFGSPEKTDIEYYGPVTSIRIWYENSFEVEYGITDMDWISLPLDKGTQRVLDDGFKIIVDKANNFKNIVDKVYSDSQFICKETFN